MRTGKMNNWIIIGVLSLIMIALLAYLKPQKDEFICIIKRNEGETIIQEPQTKDDIPSETVLVDEPEDWFEVSEIETPDGTATLMSDGILFSYQMPFADVMGYKGYYNVTFVGHPSDEYVWHHKEYLAEVAESNEPIQIAESYGFDDRTDTVRDLDGDGITELICNCQTGGDGAQRVYIFKITNGVIEVGSFDFDELMPENAILDHGTVVEYDPESNSIRLEYTIEESFDRQTEVFDDIWSVFTFKEYDSNAW